MIIRKKKESEVPLELGVGVEETFFMNEVMDCIVENKLPIIVHNGFLDMMHVNFSLNQIFLRFF